MSDINSTTNTPQQPTIEANSSTNTTDQSADAPTDRSTTNVEEKDDYLLVQKALDILKQQLNIATDDLQKLQNLKKEALSDPYLFIDDLRKRKRRKQQPKVPKLQKIVTTPYIDWNKYRFLPESRLTQQHNALNSATQYYINQTKRPIFCNILETPMATEYTQNLSTPVAVKALQQELLSAKEALNQLPSRAASVSDLSEDETSAAGAAAEKYIKYNNTNALSSKTTPKAATGRTSGKAYYGGGGSGKGKGKRRTSMVQNANTPAAVEQQQQQRQSYTTSSESDSPAILPRLQSIEPRTPDELSSTSSSQIASQNDNPQIATFNQPWTDEEQKRLQELLEIFPDEPVQAQRFNKISRALGTRTPKQVASRVQKYFIKLAKLGLPVPGRITIPPSCLPKGDGNRSKAKAKAKTKSSGNHSGARMPKSTNAPPQLRTSGVGYNSMVSGGITNSRISGGYYTQTQGPPSVFMSDDEDDSNVKVLMKTVTNTNNLSGTTDLVIHEGYACDACGTEPIVGIRYKCTVCDISEEVDLCSDCMEKGTFTNDHHTTEHTFEAVRTAISFPHADNDYTSSEHLGEYSYLGFQ